MSLKIITYFSLCNRKKVHKKNALENQSVSKYISFSEMEKEVF